MHFKAILEQSLPKELQKCNEPQNIAKCTVPPPPHLPCIRSCKRQPKLHWLEQECYFGGYNQVVTIYDEIYP